MTTIYQVSIRTNVASEYLTYYTPSVKFFKNQGDAQAYFDLLTKLQNRKQMPTTMANVSGASQSVVPVLEETNFYTINELDMQVLKRSYIVAKLDDDEKALLGIV